MRFCRSIRGENGQATVETLALVPLVVSAAVGLCALGVWFEQSQANGAVLADGTVRWLESGANGRDEKVVVTVTNGVAEAATRTGRFSLLGVALTTGERLRWIEAGP